jgi:hypothetical protein
MAPMLITWSLAGERLARRQYPTDFDSLAELGRTGWGVNGHGRTQPGGEGGQPRAAPEQQWSGSLVFARMTQSPPPNAQV